MGGCWTWLFSLLCLFYSIYSLCVSEENESDIWNKIALINKSKDENDRQFSNHLYQTSSKSTQDYHLLFLPSRMPQVLSRSPAPSSGLRSPNRPIFMKESILWKYKALSCRNLPRPENQTSVPNPPTSSKLLRFYFMSKVCPNSFAVA